MDANNLFEQNTCIFHFLDASTHPRNLEKEKPYTSFHQPTCPIKSMPSHNKEGGKNN